ncbi:hypothetical protein NPX13_g1256 [Xylaria arbuscula]|uniref:Uncharacterized protein n=1 Tax=Xylaria arbuscula TaxID=114810 RepID=A0A9W8NM06_9PEZI|nr:hypothetical protein NPX13_g1256 [Xylaria arbuscula]
MAQPSKFPSHISSTQIPWSREDVRQGTRRRQTVAQAAPGDPNHAGVIQADLPLLLRRVQATPMPQVDFGKIWDVIETRDPRTWESEPSIRAFMDFMYSNWLAQAPRPALLPCLVQFNFVRALMTNAAVLGITSSQLGDEAISYFYATGTRPSTVDTKVEKLPSSLQPTDLQRATLHHPWFDLIPVPRMRDNLFRHGVEDLDEDDLCCTLGGFGKHKDSGFVIWGNSWDVSSWEVTEEFSRSPWGWVIEGCCELRQSTNQWRAKRGEAPLFHSDSTVNGGEQGV